MSPSPYAQQGHQVRFDWGLAGANAVGGDADIVAVVDVLSFTTALTVAVDRGIEIHPYQWRDETVAAYTRDRDAVLDVLATFGITSRSPEAAAAAFVGRAQELSETAGGRELIAYGYPGDVVIAAEHNVSQVTPVLDGERFR